MPLFLGVRLAAFYPSFRAWTLLAVFKSFDFFQTIKKRRILVKRGLTRRKPEAEDVFNVHTYNANTQTFPLGHGLRV